MKTIKKYLAALVLLVPLTAAADEGAATRTTIAAGIEGLEKGVILPELSAIGYSGNERLHWEVSWTGGVKVGELEMEIVPVAGRDDAFKVDVHISTEGSLIDLAYPIRDHHVTLLQGAEKLPWLAEMKQTEGDSYRAWRLTRYDQRNGMVRSWKNGKLRGSWKIAGTTNNEFSAFLNSRLMDLRLGRPFLVYTFADKKRVPVKVTPLKKEKMKTIFGTVKTIAIMPQLTFKGLYEKQGDTVIWYTDDRCRVPVQVNSKIKIGSLTARLIGYHNPACDLY